MTLIKLPPYSPELNPIEQAWNKFFSVPGTVKSICSRDWIKLT
ncbi:transposase [Pseudoalteromonas prydzensis]